MLHARRIAQHTAPITGGPRVAGIVIHALPVGGGILALCPMPGREGAYADDIEHIREWRPALVITLVTPAEMAAQNASQLGHDMQSRGARWVHMPIPDYGVPDKAQQAKWPMLSTAARTALRGGGRVLVHCMGGCGRSGMVALRLMVEAGEPASAALARLRHVRPCAVETEDQMTWARGEPRPEFVHRPLE